MATKARRKSPSFVSFKGTFKYPKLNEADTKFKAEGEYSVKLLGDAKDPEVQALIAKLTPHYEAALSKARQQFDGLAVQARKKLGSVSENPLYNDVYDEDENLTGEVEFNFKMAASGTYKGGAKDGQTWHRKPDIFDAKGTKMKDPLPAIWSGTTGKVAFEVGLDRDGDPGYFVPGTGAAGLSLRLNGVQIIDLVSGGGRDASAYGFSSEDGYEAPTSSEGAFAEDDDEEALPGNADF